MIPKLKQIATTTKDGLMSKEDKVKLDNMSEEYSTDEIRVGTWTDGKPLYRKVFTKTISTITDGSVSNTVISLLNENVNSVILKFALVSRSNNINYLPYCNTATERFGNLYYEKSSGNYVFESNLGAFSGQTLVICLEYTKTTD